MCSSNILCQRFAHNPDELYGYEPRWSASVLSVLKFIPDMYDYCMYLYYRIWHIWFLCLYHMFPLKLVFMFNCLFEMRSDTVRCLVLPSLLQSKKQSRFTEINPRPWSIQQRASLNLPTCSSFCAGSNQSFVPLCWIQGFRWSLRGFQHFQTFEAQHVEEIDQARSWFWWRVNFGSRLQMSYVCTMIYHRCIPWMSNRLFRRCGFKPNNAGSKSACHGKQPVL